MKHKSKMNDKPQAEINTVLVAVVPEAETKHGHKGFGSVSDLCGPCVGATSKDCLLSNVDCYELLKSLPDNSIDLMFQDPPYGVTQNEWDKPIDLKKLWPEWERVVKPNGAFIFTASQPFATDLINSNRKLFKYDLVWEKSIATGFLNANRMPLRGHELILVFYKKLPTYNPIKHFLSTPSFKKGNKARSSNNYGKFSHDMEIGHKDGSRFPRSIFSVTYENSFFDSTSNTVQKTFHPTQKPIALPQYIIKTYSNPGDTIFDGYSGSGSTAIACITEKRKFIGAEIDKQYYDEAIKRISIELSSPKLF
jgi:site-specific DNA-methyltransferase (adenine-specific)